MNYMVTAVIGSQWGDEGKGKIVDFLSEDADYVVRFHGGAGAGHTVVNEYGTTKLHLIPCGIFNKNTKCVIANGVMVDPISLFEEITALEKVGVKVKDRLFISPRAHVVHQYHKILDGIFDEAKGDLKTATTRRGNGPVHADKVSYYGIKLHDLLEKKIFTEKFKEILDVKNRIIKAFGQPEVSFENTLKEYLTYGKKIKPYLANTWKIINEAVDTGQNILFEGAHGVFLDNDWGTYPYVTASSVLPSSIGSGAGLNPKKIDRIIGIARVYLTRVDTGACPMPSEIKGKVADSVRGKAHEYGATTGRPRRIGWLDLVQVRFAARLCGFTELAITKPDILSGMKTIPVCVGYKYRGKKVDYLDIDTEHLRKVKPIYKVFDGWGEDISQVKKYQDLPQNCRKYIEFIEKFVGVPVKIISVGPERNQTIARNH